jgi:pyruvate/2-oxoacid:ferredoxin oxidoreductase alpha subunit
MQMVESSNQYYDAVESHIVKAMEDFHQVVGRKYSPLEYRYYGSTEPRVAIIIMGSGTVVVNGTLKHQKSETTCVIGVRMYRPWNKKALADIVPKSVTRIAVMDRTREGGSQGEPLFLDVCTSLMQEGRGHIIVAGGRYGLGSKDFTPRMVSAIIQNMLRKNVADIQRPFTVGITDDVTKLSLPLGRPVNILDESVTQCVFWGFGSDGTVGGNKEAIKVSSKSVAGGLANALFRWKAQVCFLS